jgi:hypothetical protein
MEPRPSGPALLPHNLNMIYKTAGNRTETTLTFLDFSQIVLKIYALCQ